MVVEFFKNAAKLYIADNNAFNHIKKKVSWYVPFLILWVLTAITQGLSFGAQSLDSTIPKADLMLSLGIIIGTIILYPVLIGITSGIVFLLLKLVGGKAEFIETLKFYTSIGCVSSLLMVIIYIPLILLQVGINGIGNVIITLLTALISTVIGIWALITYIITLAKVHKISYLRAVLALIVIPLAILLVLIILIVIVAMIFAVTGGTL